MHHAALEWDLPTGTDLLRFTRQMPSTASGRKCRMRSPATLKRSPKLAEFRAQFSNLANQVYTNRPSPRFPARG